MRTYDQIEYISTICKNCNNCILLLGNDDTIMILVIIILVDNNPNLFKNNIFKIFLIIVDIISFGIVMSTDSVILVWICLAVVSIFSGFNVFDFTLLTLVIDEDEIKHGSRRETIFQGTSSLLFKPADSLGPIIATTILTVFGFITGSTSQSASAILGIKFLLFIVPAIIHALSLIFIYLFPYYGETFEQLRANLLELHAKKKEHYEKSSGERYGRRMKES